MTTKQILIINDLCSYGKVSTTAMLPILSYLGVPTGILPTSLVSNTFDYGNYSMMETTSFLADTIEKWQELGFGFEAIATGFIPTRQQADLISRYCKAEAAKETTIFVDPIMGDEGQMYKGMRPEELVGAMREMISVADLCYPNYTEACYLSGAKYNPGGVTKDEAAALLDKLHGIGAKSVLITSIVIDGQPSVAGYNNQNKEYFYLPFTEIPVHFPGTGDIFSAILIGHIMNGDPLTASTRKAMDGVYNLIDLNKDNKDKNRGIPLEKYLSIL